MNLATALDHHATVRPSETAVVAGDHRSSYADLREQAARVAAWLEERGVTADDRVLVYLPDGPGYLAALFGCWRIGAIAVPVNARFGAEEFEHVVPELSPAAVVTGDIFADGADAIVSAAPELSDADRLTLVEAGAFQPERLPPATDAPESVRRLDDDVAMVMYTLGKGATPAGVTLTHRNVGAQMEATVRHFELDGDDTAVVSLPLFHVGGLCGAALPVVFAGGTAVVQPQWDAEGWAELVAETDATYTGLVPTMMVDAVETEAAAAYDTSSLRYCVYGGAAAEEETLEAFESTFELDRLYNFYGQTETTGLAVTFDDDCEREPGLLGAATAAVEPTVVDVDSGEPVDPGEPGELLLQGDVVTPGYWNDEERTAEYVTDGWVHTGDVVRMDADGYLYYVDRVDDMIISGGENVSPSTVEHALAAMPEVEAVAVFGTDHDRLGEAVTAALVPADGADVGQEDLEAFWESSVDLAEYQRPRRVTVVDELPRTEQGTVDKAALADEF